MSNVGKIYKNEVGVLIEVETGVDCTTADLKQLIVLKPDGTTSVWTATVKTGDDSVLQYTTVEGDFNLDGNYELQAKIVNCDAGWSGWSGYSGGSGYSGYSGLQEMLVGSTAAFRVYPLND